jgi:hypothetical protein
MRLLNVHQRVCQHDPWIWLEPNLLLHLTRHRLQSGNTTSKAGLSQSHRPPLFELTNALRSRVPLGTPTSRIAGRDTETQNSLTA